MKVVGRSIGKSGSITWRGSRPWVLTVAALIVMGSIASVAQANQEGCSEAAGISESPKFTPFQDRFGSPPEVPVLLEGLAVHNSTDQMTVAGARVEMPAASAIPEGATFRVGQTLRDELVQDGMVRVFYAPNVIPDRATLTDLYSSGGVYIEVSRIPNAVSQVRAMKELLGDRAVSVPVGSGEGIVVWADPDINDVRIHTLTWAQGSTFYMIAGDLAADNIVNMGRSMVCS